MRIALIGDAVVVTSTLKVEEIETLKKYNSDALKIFDADGNQTFGVSYENGNGTLSKKGVVFGSPSRDGNGFATLTINLETEEDVPADLLKEMIADMLGDIPTKLEVIEQQAPAALSEVNAAREALINSITVL